MQFIEYPKCSTCKKAKKYLDERHVSYIDIDIVNNTPSIEELKAIIARSGYSIDKFFNTSGIKYRALNLKEKLPLMSDDEKLELLASDGMLIKRPLLVSENFVLRGFRQDEWERTLNK